MAPIQCRDKWRTALWALLAGLFIRGSSGCHPASRKLHICLNIYLERDFPLIEAIIEGQTRVGRGRGHVILEGPDLTNICSHISSLRNCYAPLVQECRAIWQLDRFARVRGVLKATHDYLCADGTNNMRDILLNSGCLTRSETNLISCTGFDWWMSWRDVLRMQVSPQDRCVALETYRDCLQRRLADVVCGTEAARVYLPLFDVWLKNWCGAGSTPEEDYTYLYYSMNALKDMLHDFNSIEVVDRENRIEE